MPLWKIHGNEAKPVTETSFGDEGILEEQLEAWLAADSEILGEPLLIFGRQVPVEGLGDRIDLLALDQEGSVVVIEVKRADLRAPVDIQALRYASYVSRWTTEDLDNVAAGYFDDADSADDERGLDVRFQEFAEPADEPELNQQQRVIIVGQTVRDRLGSVALWLREQGVDITLVEVHPFRDGQELYLEPVVIIPPPTTEEWEAVGKATSRTAKPWMRDGIAWHKGRAGNASFLRAEALIEWLQANNLVNDVSYGQKHYIAATRGTRRWIAIKPRPSAVQLELRCAPKDFDPEQVAERLGLVQFTGVEELKEKLAMPSSVGTFQRGAYFSLRLRLKPDYDISSPELHAFLQEAAAKLG